MGHAPRWPGPLKEAVKTRRVMQERREAIDSVDQTIIGDRIVNQPREGK
jgi:hypothetical protein